MAGIYLHIPFCKQACHYCDFHFSTNISRREQMVEAMCTELELQKEYLGAEEIGTIYLGGGTPSLLTLAELAKIFDRLHLHFNIRPGAEVTLEANPDDLTAETLQNFRTVGINRLSIGVQSFEDEVLKFLNRAHNGASAIRSISLAREADFNNISIDLIYAIPRQALPAWELNVKKLIEINPEHISAYSLTIEEKTVFGKWSSNGKLAAVADDQAADQLEYLVKALSAAGYDHYEVSNFGKPSYYSKHNANYWRGIPYLGIGPSAHSYNVDSRQHNIANNSRYIASLSERIVPSSRENLTVMDKANDYLLTTLRTSWGVDLQKVNTDFKYDILSVHRSYIDALISRKHAVVDNGFLKLTPSGRLLADKISSDLFLV